MKKNNDVEVVFAEAKELLEKKQAEINSEKVDYKKLIEETNNSIAKLQKESDEAYFTGNILLGDQLTSEKNKLKERAASLSKINVNVVKENLAKKYSEDSTNFYKTVMETLKNADEEDIKEARELLLKLYEITENASKRREKAIALVNAWSNNVVPFARGEQAVVYTKLTFVYHELDKGHTKDIIVGKLDIFV